MAKYVINVDLELTEKQFKTDDGDIIEYIDVATEIDGEEIGFSVKKTDKKLLKKILKSLEPEA